MITLVMADEHPATRAGLRAVLRKAPDIQIASETQDGFEAEKLVEQHQPRILLFDLEMPGTRPAETEK